MCILRVATSRAGHMLSRPDARWGIQIRARAPGGSDRPERARATIYPDRSDLVRALALAACDESCMAMCGVSTCVCADVECIARGHAPALGDSCMLYGPKWTGRARTEGHHGCILFALQKKQLVPTERSLGAEGVSCHACGSRVSSYTFCTRWQIIRDSDAGCGWSSGTRPGAVSE